MTLVEVNYLTCKKSFPYVGVNQELYSLLTNPAEPFGLHPLDLAVAQAMEQVPRAEVPDMPDRIIAATAVAHQLPLVSIDPDIQASASLKRLVRVIW
jgi:PIN domain nuclease of toxin-antitoxin system